MKKAESGKWNNLKVSHDKKEDAKPDKAADPQVTASDSRPLGHVPNMIRTQSQHDF